MHRNAKLKLHNFKRIFCPIKLVQGPIKLLWTKMRHNAALCFAAIEDGMVAARDDLGCFWIRSMQGGDDDQVLTLMDPLPVYSLVLSPVEVTAACFRIDRPVNTPQHFHRPFLPLCQGLHNNIPARNGSIDTNNCLVFPELLKSETS